MPSCSTRIRSGHALNSPAVAVQPNVDDDVRGQGLRTGPHPALHWLTHPFSVGVLAERVADILSAPKPNFPRHFYKSFSAIDKSTLSAC
jgi:hypothetical protein